MTAKKKTTETLLPKLPPPEEFGGDFGKRLLGVRQHRDLTLEQLSRLTKLLDQEEKGVSRVALSRYENGTYQPGLRELKLLSWSLRWPLSSLVYGYPEDPMNFQELNLNLALEGMIIEVLASKGLIEQTGHEIAESDQWKKLVEIAKQKK